MGFIKTYPEISSAELHLSVVVFYREMVIKQK